MRLSPRLGIALCLASLLSGCVTSQELLTKVNNLAAGIFNNLSLGAYRATPQQIRLADQRATATYSRFAPQEKKAFKESGTRYLAVRTADPTPTQRAEIRKEMQKPGSIYAGPKKAPSKIYCVMIWDTQSGRSSAPIVTPSPPSRPQEPLPASIHTQPNTWAAFKRRSAEKQRQKLLGWNNVRSY